MPEIPSDDIVLDDNESNITNNYLPLRKEDFRVQDYPMATSELMNRVVKGRINLQPVYQRGYVWDNKKAGELIDSIWNGIPIPPIFLLSRNGKLEVIDGQQRLTSVFRFMMSGDEFSIIQPGKLKERVDNGELKPLELSLGTFIANSEENVSFKDLSNEIIDRFSDLALPLIIIEPINQDNELDKKTESIVVEIFRRLNTGGQALTAHEIRHCIHPSNLLEKIRDYSQIDEWKGLFPTYYKKFELEPSLLADYAFRAIALWEKFYQNTIIGLPDLPEYSQPLSEYLNSYANYISTKISPEEQELRIQLLKKSIKGLREAYMGNESRILTHSSTRFHVGYIDVIIAGCMDWYSRNPDKDLPSNTKEIIEERKVLYTESVVKNNTSSKKDSIENKVKEGKDIFSF